MGRLCSTVLVVSVALLSFGPHAEAREESAAITLVKRLGTLRKAANAAALVEAVADAPSAHDRTSNASDQAKLRKELGKIAKQRDLGPARKAAIEALAALGAPKEAWKEVSKLLPAAKTEEATDADLAAVRAAGKLAQEKAAKPLLDLVAKAKDARLAAAAAKALGGFRAAPKKRLGVLKDLVKTGTRLEVADDATEADDPKAKRWRQVGPAIVEGLNLLTGRMLDTMESWRALLEEHRKDLTQVFTDEDD
jgi:hypothetical protein